ncbi:hemolysin III family protein [Paraconexibacter sp.]|uniref:PAQR family membrane homeostasis protein TrhA n=1 Tax=Paraconexibacter sp. TaxID=2949640 RepID=UPI003566D296
MPALVDDRPAHVAAMEKPRLRGVSHQYAFVVAVALGLLLVTVADGAQATTGAVIYAIGVCGLFGVSALYHRATWSPEQRRWMRRADHAMIFVFIAATYTPIALLVLSEPLRTTILIVVWACALGGIALQLAWVEAPKWLQALLYVAMGWVSIVTMPQILDELGALAVMGLFAGGVLYTLGAVVYARGRPDPVPAVFGYHEIFHALVVLAAASHYAVIGLAVLPTA